jgi:CRP-like cAMP-binding protein
VNGIAQIERAENPRSAERANRHEANGLDDLLKRGRVVKAAKNRLGTVTERMGTPALARVQSGRVQIFHVTDQNEKISLGVRLPGDFFGAMLSGASTTAESLDNCELMTWPQSAVEAQLEYPEVAAELLKAAVQEREHLVRRLVRSTLSCSEALAQLLLDLVDQQRGETLLPHYTHAWLAGEIGTSREIVTAAMGKLRQRGAVQYDKQSILVDTESVKASFGGRHE